jgi:hypothetical protein
MLLLFLIIPRDADVLDKVSEWHDVIYGSRMLALPTDPF